MLLLPLRDVEPQLRWVSRFRMSPSAFSHVTFSTCPDSAETLSLCDGLFPSGGTTAKLIYPAPDATSKQWKRSVREWHAVRSRRAGMFEDRFQMA
ncbi:hypothetical protein DCO57_00295 [Labrenzia sp. 011]|nr:hypothetical protein DCO57_00295 [Labrenzia sp. 011]